MIAAEMLQFAHRDMLEVQRFGRSLPLKGKAAYASAVHTVIQRAKPEESPG